MFFKKKKNQNPSSQNNSIPEKDNSIPENPQALAFEMLILTYLEFNGYNADGNKLPRNKILTPEDIKWINQTLDITGFNANIEKIIMEEWKLIKSYNPSIKPMEFVKHFLTEFHNMKIEKVAPQFIQDRNKELTESYFRIINTIEKIQGWLKDEILRTRIESNLMKNPKVQATIYQCTTPFCMVSLGCDKWGRYNIVYSADYRIIEWISERFASTLIREINQITEHAETFVNIGSLCIDCLNSFNILIEESKTEPFHEIIIKKKQ